MTPAELTATVLDNLRRNFYTDANSGHERTREFKRDERQLIRAIATYGHECNQRGWNFQADFIYQDLMNLLLQIRKSGADIGYMPVYLEGAIKRHLGLRADELNQRAKSMANRLSKVMVQIGTPASNPVRQPSAVEVFSELYRGIGKIQRARKSKKKAAQERQEQLL